MMESDKINKNNIGKTVKIFFNNFKYEGELLFEDDVIYRIDDIREGIINIPRSNSVLKEGMKNEWRRNRRIGRGFRME